MFTGIIETIGKVKRIQHRDRFARLEIIAPEILDDLKIGDSVSTKGVCLTVTELHPDGYSADCMAQTLKLTTLSELSVGDKVNVERALRLGGRLGGHLVSGHVDGIGYVVNVQQETEALRVRIGMEAALLKYTVERGSIALDGTSLTIAEMHQDGVTVSLIPHTASMTTLGKAFPGMKINIECDQILKYIERLTQFKEERTCMNSAVLEAFLRD